VLATSKQIEQGLAGKNPDVTLPKAREGRGPAVLFADVSGSMKLHERLGDAEARKVIDRLLALACKAVQAQGGRVVKTIGDEILAVLPEADAAARASCDLLAQVDAVPPQGGLHVGMHVGFHAGAFIERSGDIFGDAVNVASRLTAYAKAGQVLTTSVSAGGISPLVRRAMRKLGALDIRGRQEEMEVEEISWRDNGGEDTTVTEAMPRAALESDARLILKLGRREWTVGPQARHLVIGRDPACDVVVASTQASRTHGVVEFRNGGFFYTDKSLNGSYVSFGMTGETLIRRHQVLLSGRGLICFGHSSADAGDPLEFRIEPTGH
jgi:class 3 adenylate cyclase